ncbi:MAG: hypothetical protein JNK30_16125 [Phenylobacterium sp.]|uniref:hypothetical protein n=1 Tax=Phenylobacterium sp. TaxID=1871053 RepID=UPI001A46AB11|nr:hypothetical protein [Phenylobacterium sp.]MBL8772909.1 hypothetical protein [Phenylobacterium sp.]
MRLVLFAALALVAATPALALTVSGTPARPADVAQHLKPASGPAASLQDSFAGAGRPTAGLSGPPAHGDVSFGFGPVRATVTSAPSPAPRADRRDTPAPLSLAPYAPRR